jgi:hypothetical protein
MGNSIEGMPRIGKEIKNMERDVTTILEGNDIL